MRGFVNNVATGALILWAAGASPAGAADQGSVGPGNAAAMALSAASPLVKSAKAFLMQEVALIGNAGLREATTDAIANDATCVRHRAGLDLAKKTALLDRLKSEGLVASEDDERIPGGLLAGVFPPLADDGAACPHT